MLGQFHCYICPTDYLTPEDLHQHNVQFHSNFADSTVNFTMPVNPQVAPFSNTRGGATSHETASCSTATAIPRRRAEVTFPDATFQITTKEGMGLPTAKPKRRAKTDAERQHTNVMRILKACDECRRTKQRCDPSHKKRKPDESKKRAKEGNDGNDGTRSDGTRSDGNAGGAGGIADSGTVAGAA